MSKSIDYEIKQIENSIKNIENGMEMTKLKELRNMRNKLYEEREKINQLKLVGNCYKYRNSYGHGDSWWLYIKVIEKDGEVYELEIQELSQVPTDIEVRLTKIFSTRFDDPSYKKISKKEYDRAVKPILDKLMEMNNGTK